MQLLHETNYFAYNENVTKPIKILILSDLHYSDLISKERLDWILQKIAEINPDYIFFCGDMIDSVDDISGNLYTWWTSLNQIAQGLISIGSHDYWRSWIDSETGKLKFECVYPVEFFERLNALNHVCVLNNENYQDDYIFATGYTQGIRYYYSTGINFETHEFERKTANKIIPEDKDVMISELTELMEQNREILTSKETAKKMKFLLAHALTYGFDTDVSKLFTPYNYVIGGHSHNGLVPPIINELWPTTIGFISPDRSKLQPNVRNTLRNKGDKVIVNGPLTTFQKCSGIKAKLNAFYPSNITVLTIANDKVYDTEKIYTKQRYTR